MSTNVDTTLEYTDDILEQIAVSADMVARVKKWFDEAKTAREAQTDRWRKNEKLYYGQHWTGSKNDSRTRLIYNFPLSNVETILPIISDHLPVVDVMPKNNSDVPFTDMIQIRFQQLADDAHLYDKIMQAIKDSLIYSNGYIEILPQLNANGSLTGLSVNIPDPYTVFPHRFATGLETANYVLFATPMHVDDIEHQYGVKVSPEGNLDDYRSFQSTEDEQLNKDNDMALVIECFSRDKDRENYPYGRFTAICRDKLLVDEPVELPRMPYFMVANYKSPHTYYGIGEPEIVRTQTKAINEIMSAIADNIRESGNPIRKMTQRFIAKNPNGFNPHAGGKVIVDDPHDLSWDAPPAIPGYVQYYIQQSILMKDAITGVQDVTAGRQPTGVTAASAIAALQEAAQTRIRYKIAKDITTFVRDIGEYCVRLIQIFDDQVTSLRSQTATGQHDFVEYNPQAVINGKTMAQADFIITVTTGIKQQTGRLAAEERAIRLYEMGIYGVEDVVMALNEPNKQELIERFYQRQQQQMAQQQQAAGGEQLPPEVVQQFDSLVSQALPGTPEAEQLENLIREYPQLQEAITA